MKALPRFVLVFFALDGQADGAADFPSPPSREEWTFVRELDEPPDYVPQWSRPAASNECDFSRGVSVVDCYGLQGDLATVRLDLGRFLSETGLNKGTGVTVRIVRGTVDDRESYRLDVAADGVTLTAGDDDGVRRAVHRLESRLLASPAPALPLGAESRRSWLKTRFSRSFFAPVNRYPLYTDELMDDEDYYPDGFLDRISHEAVNALWVTVRLREVSVTPWTPADPNMSRRIAKLKKVAAKLRRYGIGLWVFSIEPHAVAEGDAHYNPKEDPLFLAHPEWFRHRNGSWVACPSEPGVRDYVAASLADLFRRVPELAGYVNISYGERSTTCLSRVLPTPEQGADPLTNVQATCPKCARLTPARMHELMAEAFARGIRSVKPDGRYLSWFYVPYQTSCRHEWLFDVPRHLPDGVTLMFNFESGDRKCQLGRIREGGDYWLADVGPSEVFRRMCATGRVGAKLQVGCGFELGTVPVVPVPALLYRKYREMKKLGVDTAMQCWLIGSAPGVQTAAAGELAFEDFDAESEIAFLERLAAPEWGPSASRVAAIWEAYSEAFSLYPFSQLSQYYSPINEGVCWPLYPDVVLKPMTPSWKPFYPPCGDTVGEAFDSHTLSEALSLVMRMSELPEVRDLPATTAEQRRDRGLLRAVALHFRSARNALEFYWQRRAAISSSRDFGNLMQARRSVAKMAEIIRDELTTASEMRELSAADMRLGYHAEAERHRYFPRAFDWRIARLGEASARLAEIDRTLAEGHPYPESDRERTASVCPVNGNEVGDRRVRWHLVASNGVFQVHGRCAADVKRLDVLMMNATGSEFPIRLAVKRKGLVPYLWQGVPDETSVSCTTAEETEGWTFDLTMNDLIWSRDPALRPGWIFVQEPKEDGYAWPENPPKTLGRLLQGPPGDVFGRIIWPNQ